MPTEQKFVSAHIPLIDGVQIFTNRSEVEQVAVRRNMRKYNKCLKRGDGLLTDTGLKHCFLFACMYLDCCSLNPSEQVFF